MSSKEGYPDRQRFIQTPVDLVLAYRTRPRHAAVYAIIARFCEVARGPVALSRDDLALLFDATRDDPVGVQIERAIRDMRRDGWLLHTNKGQPGKRELLVTWGPGRDDQPRPWRFEQPHRGRPAQLATARMPLALLDHYLGRLVLQPDAPAQVERYVSQPLLDLTDLSTFLLRQIGQVPPTTRLTQLDLVDGVPDLAVLLAQVGAGTLVIDDNPAAPPITLTDAGVRQLQRCRAAGDVSHPDARHGSSADPSDARHGSRHGSLDSIAHYAPACGKPQPDAVPDRAWDQDGMNQQTNMDSSPQESPPCVETLVAAGMFSNRFYVNQKNRTPEPDDSAAACDEKHKQELDPQIATAHTLLNPARGIPHAEWWALGLLVQEHGAATVLRWQRRAIGAGRTCITLPYYDACAATEALGMSRSRASVPLAAPAPLPAPAVPPAAASRPAVPEPLPAPEPRPPRGGAPASASSPAVPLSAEHEAIIAQLTTACGTPIRYPEKLAAAPLPLLERWAAMAGHPGLRAKGDPAALIVHAAALGKEPPTVAELNRWAEQAGTHWSQLGAWADASPAVAAAVLAPAPVPRMPLAAAEATPPEVPSAAAPLRSSPAAATPPAAWTAATLQTALHAQLRLMCPRADWPLIAALQVQQLADGGVVLACATVPQHAQIAATLHGCIGSALTDLDAPRAFRIGVGAPPPAHGRPGASTTRAATQGGVP